MPDIRTFRALPLALALIATPAAAADPSDEVVRRGLESYLDAAAALGFTGAVLVARAGEILLERGYGERVPGTGEPVGADTVFTTGSITKQFTAAAVLELEEQGRLSVEDPIAKHLDGVPAAKRAITIHHLLTHQAGLPDALGDDFEPIGREPFVARALAAPLLFEPGSGYAYSNVGYSLAAAIVERVSGEDYERFLRRHLFEPAGMLDTGYALPGWPSRRLAHAADRDGRDWGTVLERALADSGPGWNLLGNGGVHSTVGDVLRWHRALAGERILSAASKAKLYAKHVDEGGGTWYGYGWSIEPTPWGEMLTHNGGNPFFFADLLRFPDDDVVVYYTTSSRDRRMRRLARPLARIVFTGEVPQLEPPPALLVAPGSQPAPEGSAAARWRLPGTAAGERAGTLLDVLAAADPAARRAYATTGFTSAVTEQRGVEGLVALLERIRGDVVPIELRGYAARPGGIDVVLRFAHGPAPLRIKLEVEPEPPHRIAGIAVQVGD
jgi:CubicO group peptidase (beta-lactamase class C family)